MKVYICMMYDNEEFHVGKVFDNYYDAREEIGNDQFDDIIIREVE